ncbi:TDT family transporter [Iodobacter fluviatilis]|uniref:Tellurite resistance protein tehA n=1 Tax=Iodobacter fluviatilis TaxID=537 RepID=A0A377SU32_9NEIS|nr:TDT family transporter [Iodobacter fluviatilis]TCU82098.1 tellurite resistance protein TehA-like permease [Iodobacter fluviatilis]STR44808.1 Tellurite resistance protein tehA [Iodobacter fluviatilis]
MFKRIHQLLAAAPTPMAGLALGLASLGWCWENAGDFSGYAQLSGAVIASVLLLILAFKFVLHPRLLLKDLAHPVVGSVVPTFAMATMVVSKASGHFAPAFAEGLWLFAVILHMVFLATFIWHRAKDFEIHHMVPSWFVPPVGIIVADVAFPGGQFAALANGLLWFGIFCYAVMLPLMLYRLIFSHEVPDAAKPTIAILAAPASLSLAGYLTVTTEPSLLIVALLFGIAVLMTGIIYLAFFKLLILPFSPGYAAFTFPLVIGATALFKVSHLLGQWEFAAAYVNQIQWLAQFELGIATVVVGYVALRYAIFFMAKDDVVTFKAGQLLHR